MGVGYVRAKKVLKKGCSECGTVWDDGQIVDFDGLSKYGGGSCPFCHSNWALTTIRKIPKIKLKKDRDSSQ